MFNKIYSKIVDILKNSLEDWLNIFSFSKKWFYYDLKLILKIFNLFIFIFLILMLLNFDITIIIIKWLYWSNLSYNFEILSEYEIFLFIV